MEMRIILLAFTVLYSTVFTVFITCAPPAPPPGFEQVLKACNESENSIDNVELVEFFGESYKDNMYQIEATDAYFIKWIITPNEDGSITENNVEMKCDSGEIKGTGKVTYIEKENVIQNTYKLNKGTTYSLYFESKWDKTPTEGDICDLEASIVLDGVKNSYCIKDKAKIIEAE